MAVGGRHDTEGPQPERGVPVQSRRVLEYSATAHAPPVCVDHCLVSLVISGQGTVGTAKKSRWWRRIPLDKLLGRGEHGLAAAYGRSAHNEALRFGKVTLMAILGELVT